MGSIENIEKAREATAKRLRNVEEANRKKFEAVEKSNRDKLGMIRGAVVDQFPLRFR